MEMEALQTDAMAPAPYRIQRVRRETDDTFTLELAQSMGVKPPPFLPGQFNMLYVFGVGEVAISISGNPATPETLIHTTRAVGSVTKAMSQLHAGQMLGIRGPYGTAWPIQEAEGDDILIITGGIGLAPLRPLIYHLLAHRDRYGKVVLLYGARTPADILYRKEIEQWRGRFDFDVLITVDRATNNWRGQVGVVTQLIQRAPFDPYHASAFVCGPEVMMTYSIESLEKRGVPAAKTYLSLERNMKCAIGLCGHCQYGPAFVCKDGPVFRFDQIEHLFPVREV